MSLQRPGMRIEASMEAGRDEASSRHQGRELGEGGRRRWSDVNPLIRISFITRGWLQQFVLNSFFFSKTRSMWKRNDYITLRRMSTNKVYIKGKDKGSSDLWGTTRFLEGIKMLPEDSINDTLGCEDVSQFNSTASYRTCSAFEWYKCIIVWIA